VVELCAEIWTWDLPNRNAKYSCATFGRYESEATTYEVIRDYQKYEKHWLRLWKCCITF
jgi:hypothetical protein